MIMTSLDWGEGCSDSRTPEEHSRPTPLKHLHQYFEEFALLTVSVDKALAYFATHPDTVLGLFGLYCEESGLTLKQAA